jgi:DnaJ family protein C protein 7
MKFFDFKKQSKKQNPAADDQDGDEADDYFLSHPSSPTKAAPSPTKSPTKSPVKKSDSPASRESHKQRPPRTFGRHSTDPGSASSRRKKIDPDTHPLNLPPEERKRLSALSAMSDRNSMDAEKEPVNGGSSSPSSTPPQQPPQAAPQPKPAQNTNSFTLPMQEKADSTNNTNGTNGKIVIDLTKDEEDVPAPPPHRSQPQSPAQTAAEDAETFKNEGNKYFKAKEYTRAIEYYTKGEYHSCSIGRLSSTC